MIYSDHTLSEEKNLHALPLLSLRIICIFAIAVNLFYVLYGLVIDIPEVSIICSFYALGGLFALILSLLGRQTASKFVVITSTAISLMVTFHTFTIGYTILAIYFPVILSHLYIFDYGREKKPFLASLAISVLTVILSLMLPRFQYLKVVIPDPIANLTDNVHGLVSLFVTTFLLIIIVQYKTKANKLLEEKKKDLESAITELTETRDQLIQTEKMASLGLLTAGINHEINNPLNFMAGGLENLKNMAAKKGDKAIKEYLHVFEEGIRRIEEIVSGLNHFNYRSTSFDDSCDVHAMIENCLKILSHELKDRIIITRDYSQDLAVVGNSGQLHQVFMNLLANGAQAIEHKGEIAISTRKENGLAVIEIADSGSGIPDDVKKNIFDPFFTTKEPGIGTGLGLSVSYSIVNKHQGAIEVDSIPGEGTTFCIRLPLQKSADPVYSTATA